MKKRQNNSARASALQITLSVALLSFAAILFASSFKAAAPAAQGLSQPIVLALNAPTAPAQSGFYPPLPQPAAPEGVDPNPLITVSLPVSNFDINVPASTVILVPVTTTLIDPTTTAGLDYIGFQGDFTFDSAVVSFPTPPPSSNTQVQGAGLTSFNWNVSANILNTGPGTIKTLRVSAFSLDSTPLFGMGTLFNLKFLRVSSTPGDTSPLVWAPFPQHFIYIDTDLASHVPNQTNGLITITQQPTPSPTPTSTATSTPTATATASSTATATVRPSPTPTATFTPRTSPTPTATFTPRNSPTPTATATATFTPRTSPTPTATFTPRTTPSPTATSTATATFTPRTTPSPTATATATATFTPRTSPTPTATFTPRTSPTPTATSTVAGTPSPTPTATATFTPRTSPTPTATFTPRTTPSPTATSTATATATARTSPTPTATFTPRTSPTPTATFTPRTSPTPTATFTPRTSPTPTATSTPIITPTPTPTPPLKVSLPFDTFNPSVPASTVIIEPVTTSFISPGLDYVAFQGDFTFDSAVVSFDSPAVQPAGLTATNWNVSANVINTGPGTTMTLRVSAFSQDQTPLNGSGTLFELRMLRVSSTPGDMSPLVWAAPPNQFIFIDENLNKEPPDQNDGLITIGSGTCDPLGDCTPPYPYSSANPRTNIAFNESEVLRAFRMTVNAACVPTALQVFYNDEHALTLGVREVQTKTSSGTTSMFYPVSMMTMNPDSAQPPMTGATEAQGGTDVAGRPMFPSLFVTDMTANPGNPYAGDWQEGGMAIPPDATFGTWKAAVRKVDTTRMPNVVTVTPDADPAANHWNLGPGSDPVPPGLVDQGYGNEVRWNMAPLNLIPGHQYRLYFMVHDGDQNKEGGDSGQGCVIFTMPGGTPQPTPTPSASPTPSNCPTITVKPGSNLPHAVTGSSYSKTISASGGNSPYTFAITGGSLPPGLTMGTNGKITGTPTASGTYMFTVTATDEDGCQGSKQFTLVVDCPDIELHPGGALSDGKVGQSYSKTFTADHGQSPYTFMVISGSLPPGLTLSPSGVLSGVPTTAGAYAFTVQATDSNGCAGSKLYTLKIKNP